MFLCRTDIAPLHVTFNEKYNTSMLYYL